MKLSVSFCPRCQTVYFMPKGHRMCCVDCGYQGKAHKTSKRVFETKSPSTRKIRKQGDTQRRAWRRAAIRQKPSCDYCQTPLGFDDATVDHIIPLVRGGKDEPHNWTIACKKCNQKKGTTPGTRINPVA